LSDFIWSEAILDLIQGSKVSKINNVETRENAVTIDSHLLQNTKERNSS